MRNVYGWSAVALMCLVGSAFAQNEAQPLQPGVGQQPRSTAGQQPGQPGGLGQQGLRQQQAGQHGTSDQQIAAFLLACCRNEIEISKFAHDRLQSQEAKAFAEKMVREHTPGCEQMAQMAGPLGQGLHVGGHDEAQPGALRPGATRPGQPGATQPRTPGADRPGIRSWHTTRGS
jgi:predicted outer membrane protein